ncbi:hypothetical protein ABXS75_17255 [Roseburia hominis]
MAKQDYFKEALSNFTHEAASGGAIRHLADLGYSVEQIVKRLSFPTPYERVQKTVWEHLFDTEVLLAAEPGSERQQEKAVYVKDYDKYGRLSFRRVVSKNNAADAVYWKEYRYAKAKDGKLIGYMLNKCRENGEETAYVSCDFGLRMRDAASFDAFLETLNACHREYILGIPWEEKMVYHRLNQQMREIVAVLYENAGYHSVCYFMKLGEKIYI